MTEEQDKEIKEAYKTVFKQKCDSVFKGEDKPLVEEQVNLFIIGK